MTDLTPVFYSLLSHHSAPHLSSPPTIRSLTHDEFLKEAYLLVMSPPLNASSHHQKQTANINPVELPHNLPNNLSTNHSTRLPFHRAPISPPNSPCVPHPIPTRCNRRLHQVSSPPTPPLPPHLIRRRIPPAIDTRDALPPQSTPSPPLGRRRQSHPRDPRRRRPEPNSNAPPRIRALVPLAPPQSSI
jgi:hypothetical protein